MSTPDWSDELEDLFGGELPDLSDMHFEDPEMFPLANGGLHPTQPLSAPFPAPTPASALALPVAPKCPEELKEEEKEEQNAFVKSAVAKPDDVVVAKRGPGRPLGSKKKKKKKERDRSREAPSAVEKSVLELLSKVPVGVFDEPEVDAQDRKWIRNDMKSSTGTKSWQTVEVGPDFNNFECDKDTVIAMLTNFSRREPKKGGVRNMTTMQLRMRSQVGEPGLRLMLEARGATRARPSQGNRFVHCYGTLKQEATVHHPLVLEFGGECAIWLLYTEAISAKEKRGAPGTEEYKERARERMAKGTLPEWREFTEVPDLIDELCARVDLQIRLGKVSQQDGYKVLGVGLAKACRDIYLANPKRAEKILADLKNRYSKEDYEALASLKEEEEPLEAPEFDAVAADRSPPLERALAYPEEQHFEEEDGEEDDEEDEEDDEEGLPNKRTRRAKVFGDDWVTP